MLPEAQTLERLARTGGVTIHRSVRTRGGITCTTTTRIVPADEVPLEQRAVPFPLYVVYDHIIVDDNETDTWREYHGVRSVADAVVDVPNTGNGEYTMPEAERLAQRVNELLKACRDYRLDMEKRGDGRSWEAAMEYLDLATTYQAPLDVATLHRYVERKTAATPGE